MKYSIKDVDTEILVKCWRKRIYLETKEKIKVAKRINTEMKKRIGGPIPSNLYSRIPEFKHLRSRATEKLL